MAMLPQIKFIIMANLINLTVVSSSVSSKGGHIVKLQNKSAKQQITPFGVKKVDSQTTYYIKLETAGVVGFSADLDIDQFNVVDREFVPEDAKPGDPAMVLKWLQLK